MNIKAKFLFGGRMFIDIPDCAKKLAKFFPEGLYVVGGYVRNKLLNLSGGDIDLASDVDIDEVVKRLEGSAFVAKVKNLQMGTLEISCQKTGRIFEYTAFRKEKYSTDGKHFPVSVSRTHDIREDAIRRDFSINSIYYNISKDEIVDFYHGIIDLKQRVVRCNINPGDVLQYDGERILRMIRIAGELDFKIEKQTMLSAIKFSQNIKALQGGRRYREIQKILNCDQRYGESRSGLKRALKLLNLLSAWHCFGLKSKKIKHKMSLRMKSKQDRFLGVLIDIVDTEKPECLETFIEEFLCKQFAFSNEEAQRVFKYMAGYYDALNGMNNKEYFFKYYNDWAQIYQLLSGKSKRVLARYNFFYQYIIEHGLVIKVDDLAIDENDIKRNFPDIDRKNYAKILKNLLSKVFDGKVLNKKQELLDEIEKNLQNY